MFWGRPNCWNHWSKDVSDAQADRRGAQRGGSAVEVGGVDADVGELEGSEGGDPAVGRRLEVLGGRRRLARAGVRR